MPAPKDLEKKEIWRQKISRGLKGRKLSNEHKKHLIDSKKKDKYPKMGESKKGFKNPMYGKQFSEEHRRKLSIASVGNRRGFGYRHTEQDKKKISLAGRGRELSEEHKKKLAIVLKRKW